MTLTVTDSAGRKYKATCHFREPKLGEFLYCFDHKRVEWRGAVSATGIEKWLVETWCSNGHPEFMLHRIICAPVPVEYEVRVRLTTEEFVGLRLDDGKDCSATAAVKEAIRNGDYEEVTP